mmetsp:Transcript_48871/g.52776  ORF Transcript_48871/g.52776 Transcript_48871/m.52776 type:complete len:83 (+) Transcript_48871:273-521(+)
MDPGNRVSLVVGEATSKEDRDQYRYSTADSGRKEGMGMNAVLRVSSFRFHFTVAKCSSFMLYYSTVEFVQFHSVYVRGMHPG